MIDNDKDSRIGDFYTIDNIKYVAVYTPRSKSCEGCVSEEESNCLCLSFPCGCAGSISLNNQHIWIKYQIIASIK